MNEDDDTGEDYDSTKGVTEDVFECTKCGHVGQALATVHTDWVPAPFGTGNVPMQTLGDDLKCQSCGSQDLKEFMRKPTNLPKTNDKEVALTETDPDWRDRFGGDVDNAYRFYFGV